MQKEKFGKICASLRRDCFDPHKGRVWSQADLAEASNLHLRLIGQLEQGKRVKIDNEILSGLAQAFGMTTIEKQRFFTLANTIENEPLDQNEIKQVVEVVQQSRQPVLLHDGLYRIISANSAFFKIYGLTTDYLDSIDDDDPTKFHIARHIHDPNSPIREVYKNQIEAIELNNVIYWRYFSVAHRHGDEFDKIQETLFETCPNFGYLWSAINNKVINKDIKNLMRQYDSNHQSLGRLQYFGLTTNLSYANHELFSVILHPIDSETHFTFQNIDGYGSLRIIKCLRE